jgi:RNA polymerase sigma factor (sigma-70 family)
MKKRHESVDGHSEDIKVSENVGELLVSFRREDEREIWREKKRKNKSLDYLEGLGIELPDGSMNVEEDYILKEEKTLLYSAIEKLPPQQKELIRRYFFYNESLQDIAAEQEVSYQAIQNRIKKSLEKLKKIFAIRGCIAHFSFPIC